MRTAFTYACINHRVENAAYWLKRFPQWNVNREIHTGTTALSWALIIPNSQDNCVDIVRLLLGAGARVGIRNHFGFTSLHCAAYSWNIPLEAFDLMIKKFQIDPTETIYIEDIAKNLSIGKERGAKTVWLINDEYWGKKESDKEYIDYKIKNLSLFLKEIRLLKNS